MANNIMDSNSNECRNFGNVVAAAGLKATAALDGATVAAVVAVVYRDGDNRESGDGDNSELEEHRGG